MAHLGLPKVRRSVDARLVVVGDGHERRGLMGLAEEEGAEDRVVFTGCVLDEELPGAYAGRGHLRQRRCGRTPEPGNDGGDGDKKAGGRGGGGRTRGSGFSYGSRPTRAWEQEPVRSLPY